MIAHLTGKFLYKSPTQLIVDCNGVGYEVHISLNTYSAIQDKEQGSLFCFLKIAEDANTIYGFATQEEKQMFTLLISVSGVGAGTGRMVLSSLKPSELQSAIAGGNVKLLESIKGIGKKTAERLVLELKDKMGKQTNLTTVFNAVNNSLEQEALEALAALGINRLGAQQAMQKIMQGGFAPKTVEELIKMVLKTL